MTSQRQFMKDCKYRIDVLDSQGGAGGYSKFFCIRRL